MQKNAVFQGLMEITRQGLPDRENALRPGQDGMRLNTDASMGDTQRNR